MKRLIFLNVAFAILLGVCSNSCSKKDAVNSDIGDPWDNEIPKPKPQDDNSNYGIYRGAFIGSKGFATINIGTGTNLIAQLKIDGNIYYLKATQAVSQNQPISNLHFTGPSVAFDFSCNANGSNPVVSNIAFSGHPNARIVLLKSLSNLWVDLWQCTYQQTGTSGETGIFMLAITHELIGLGASNNLSDIFIINGSATGGHITATTIMNGVVTNISGNVSSNVTTVSGSFSNSNVSGTWSGTRFVD